MIAKIKIDNSKDAAVDSKKWDPSKSELIKAILNASQPSTLMREVFLVCPEKVGDLEAKTCGYPHHDIIDSKCVLNLAGVKAAYARAKQQGIYEGEVKEHLDRHRKELGLDKAEKEFENAVSGIDTAFKLIQEALSDRTREENPDHPENLFEKVSVNPSQNGTPIPQGVDNSGVVNPGDNTGVQQNQPVTIPVGNVDPTEDTLTNNPVEGPDDRDQDNLDGNQRKEMYQRFADVMTQANRANVFGTIFDQDIFRSEYKIVPYEMRYFYRLQNPVSVENGDLRFIPFGTELLEAQEKYQLGKKMFVFATNNDKPIFFNMLDKTIWFNDDKVGDTFDAFIENLTQNNGELNIDEEEDPNANQDANVEYAADPGTMDQPQQDATPTDGMAPIDLSNDTSSQQNLGNAAQPAMNTGLENTTPQQGGQPDLQPIDLNAQPTNASTEFSNNDSLLDMFGESFKSASSDDSSSPWMSKSPFDENDSIVDMMEDTEQIRETSPIFVCPSAKVDESTVQHITQIATRYGVFIIITGKEELPQLRDQAAVIKIPNAQFRSIMINRSIGLKQISHVGIEKPGHWAIALPDECINDKYPYEFGLLHEIGHFLIYSERQDQTHYLYYDSRLKIYMMDIIHNLLNTNNADHNRCYHEIPDESMADTRMHLSKHTLDKSVLIGIQFQRHMSQNISSVHRRSKHFGRYINLVKVKKISESNSVSWHLRKCLLTENLVLTLTQS